MSIDESNVENNLNDQQSILTSDTRTVDVLLCGGIPCPIYKPRSITLRHSPVGDANAPPLETTNKPPILLSKNTKTKGTPNYISVSPKLISIQVNQQKKTFPTACAATLPGLLGALPVSVIQPP